VSSETRASELFAHELFEATLRCAEIVRPTLRRDALASG
jgi:hypothetical protein